MKKMMVLVAAIALAFASQAASFKWTANNMYGADGAKFAGEITLMAYLNNGVATADDAVAVATFTPTTAGVVNKTFADETNFAGGSYYNFFFTASQTVDGKDYTFISAEVSNIQAQALTTPTVGFGNMTAQTSGATSNWSAVPEPTSGLLLLLGMAALALKRKQA